MIIMAVTHVNSVDLPNTILANAENKSAAHRNLAQIAISKGLTLVIPDADATIPLSISLSADFLANLQQVAKKFGLTPASAFGGLVNAELLSRVSEIKEKKEDFSKPIKVTSVILPDIMLTKSANKVKAHKALVNHALNKGLLPIIPTPENTITLTLTLHPEVRARLSIIAKEHGMTVAGAFAAMANAGLQSIESTSKKDEILKSKFHSTAAGKLLVDKNKEDRPQQREFWLHLATGLQLKKVGMNEASTGVGKGLCIVSAAILKARQGSIPVIIASPTLKGTAQLWREFEEPAPTAAAKGLDVALLPAKAEIVDDTRLRAYLEKNPDPAVLEWVNNGGPNNVDTTLSRAAERQGTTLNWLMDDLRAIATNLRPEDFAVDDTTPETSEGAKQLAVLREYAANAQIIFCTQAMLARISIGQWKLLPLVREKHEDDTPVNEPVVIIDEAHLFEEIMAGAISNDMSLQGLKYRLKDAYEASQSKTGSSLDKAIKTVEKLVNECKAVYNGETIKLVDSSWKEPPRLAQQVSSTVLSHLKDLKKQFQTKGAMQTVASIKNDKEVLNQIIKTLEGSISDRLHLEYTAERHYPLFRVGPPSVKRNLGYIWSTATGGVALVSATFYLPSGQGGMTCDYMREVLALPLARMDIPPPVVWKEIYNAPTLYLPHSSIAQPLVPPDDESPDKLDAWTLAQATQIKNIAASAKGGTLVLCTSYAQVNGLKHNLVSGGMDEDRIVANSGRLVDDQKKYVTLHAEGKRPVWLVLGPGWAGIDLVEEGKLAEEDTLLTDLVITRMPIGINRSVTMQTRMNQSHFRPVGQETMLRLKQGLGRIIRRAGLKDRRIWLLDGRLVTSVVKPSSNFMAELVSGVYRLIERYKKRSEFGFVKSDRGDK